MCSSTARSNCVFHIFVSMLNLATLTYEHNIYISLETNCLKEKVLIKNHFTVHFCTHSIANWVTFDLKLNHISAPQFFIAQYLILYALPWTFMHVHAYFFSFLIYSPFSQLHSFAYLRLFGYFFLSVEKVKHDRD